MSITFERTNVSLGLFCTVFVGCGASFAATTAQDGATKIQEIAHWQGHRMFEDFSARTQVSPDGRWVLRTSVDGVEDLLRRSDLRSDDVTMRAGLDPFERIVFCGRGTFFRLGTLNGIHGWFGPGSDKELGAATHIPPAATPVCSLDGHMVAHYTSYPPRASLPPPTDVFVGTAQAQTRVKLPGTPIGATFSNDGKTLYVLVRQPGGASSLVKVSSGNLRAELLKRDLDAWPYAGVSIATSPDDSQVVLSLGSLRKPDNAERQVPLANRWLRLVAYDLRSQSLITLQMAEGRDQTDPSVVDKDLYWVDIKVEKSVIALPIGGGTPHTVVSGREAYAPSWSRDGRLAFVYGQYRLVDWALDQDVGIVNVDSSVHATSEPKVFIQGNHEDFPPDWSPNRKWIVWHSHRDPHKNAAYYDAPGTTDDIWIRAAEDTKAPERLLTHGVWETGWAYWSPDGTKVIYTTWDRNGEPGLYHVWVTAVNQETGAIGTAHELKLPAAIHSPQIADWSPDGRQIAIEDADSSSERTLWVASSDGDKATKLVSYPSETYGGISWTPDGKTLVVAALDDDKMQIYSIPSTGGSLKRLSNGMGNLLLPRVSPDGKWIACAEVETLQTLKARPYPNQ